MVADILNIVSLNSGTTVVNGSSVDTSRLTRKSVFVTLLAGSNTTVSVDASPDNSSWYSVDSKTYATSATRQSDVFSYTSHFPYMRAAITNISGTNLSAIITGRGV
jgi:hypothetical protein